MSERIVGRKDNGLLWVAMLLTLLVAADFITTYLCLTAGKGLVETGIVARHVVDWGGLSGLALLDMVVVLLLVGAASHAKGVCSRRGEHGKGEWAARLTLYPYMIAVGYAVFNNAGWLLVG